MRGAEALALAREYRPMAISLDVFLPDMLGWTVLSQLKQDPRTRHIPVQIVTLDEDRQHGLARGAFSFINKPTTTGGLEDVARPASRNTPSRAASACWWSRTTPPSGSGITELLGSRRHRYRSPPSTGAEALALLRREPADCIVLDLRLPDMTGLRAAGTISAPTTSSRDVPVVVFTGRELSPEEDAQLHTMARSVVVKGVESPERLLDETALFLHRVIADLPPEKQRMLERLHNSDETLHGRTVLLVDDDARNIFALSSVLERRGMHVRHRHDRARGDIVAAIADTTCCDRADGHHDAGNGRLRDDAR